MVKEKEDDKTKEYNHTAATTSITDLALSQCQTGSSTLRKSINQFLLVIIGVPASCLVTHVCESIQFTRILTRRYELTIPELSTFLPD